MKTKIPRSELVRQLVERDGLTCQYPTCSERLDLEIVNDDSPWFVTIDHTKPQAWCRENGWTQEQTWALSNLTLMHKKCNAKKSDLLYDEEGNLPPKPGRALSRRQKRSERKDVCDTCYSGRILLIGETCPTCGSGPQPSYPTAYQRNSNECPHSGPYSCWACMCGIVNRAPAIITVLDGEFMDE